MAVTIKDIANAAGVSRGTVDRVVNNRGGVKPELERKIRQLIAELDYKPNRAGKVLAALKKPMKIGCLLPGIESPFFDGVIRGLHQAEREFSDFGISLEISLIKGFDPQTHIRALNELKKKNVSAICAATMDVPEIRNTVNEIIASGIPVSTVNSDLSGTRRLFYVGCNYPESGRTAAGLLNLIRRDEMELLIVTGSLSMQGHNQRIQSFLKELSERGARYHMAEIIETSDDSEVAYRRTMEALSAFPKINGIYITSGGVDGVCHAVCERNLSGKATVLSFDDVPSTKRLVMENVISATICQEPIRQGYLSIRLLFEYLVNHRTPEKLIYYTNNVIKIRQNI